MDKEILKKHTIYQTVTGSTAYGLDNDNSDIDEKAIVILPANYTFQLAPVWETETFHNPDIEYHSLKKAIKLMQFQNPTMLELLFVSERFISKQTSYGEALKNHRDLFLTQNCYYTFGGYARDQLMRIKNGLDKATAEDQTKHITYKMEQMIHDLARKFAMDEGFIEIINIYDGNQNKLDVELAVNLQTIFLTKLNSFVAELNSSLKNYNKMTSRNKKPADKLTKHAMHLVRLLLMGIEVLEYGTLTVYREKDRDFLLAIRNGEYSWDELFDIADNLFKKLDKSKHKSVLPEKIDGVKINQLYFELMSNYYGMK